MNVSRKAYRRLLSASGVALASIVGTSSQTFGEVWIKTTNSNTSWDVAANWQDGLIPDAIDSLADFSKTDIRNHKITISDAGLANPDNQIITGTILISDTAGANAFSFDSTAGQTWLFKVSTGRALIHRVDAGGTGGTNFNADFILGSNLLVRNDAPASNAQFFMNGDISESGGSFGIEIQNVDDAKILQLNGNSTFSGGVIITTGSVRTGGAAVMNGTTIVSSPFGLGTITMKGGILASNDDRDAGGDRVIANALRLDGNVTIGGTTGGINGALTFTGSTTLARDVQLTPGGSNSGFLDFQGVIGEEGGPRSLTLANGGGNASVTLSAANTYTGSTYLVTNSRLALNNALALQHSTLDLGGDLLTPKFVTAAGPSFTVGGLANGNYDVTVDSSPFVAATVLDLTNDTGGAITLQVGNNNSDQTYNGVIQGVGGIVKIGTGTQTLNPAFATSSGTLLANSYSGGTVVAAGKLVINSDNSGAGAVQVNAGATLGGGGTIASATTVDGSLAPGASTGLLTLQSSLTMGSGANTEIEIGGTDRGVAVAGYDAVVVGGTLILDGTVTVSFVDGFTPASGATFDVLDWAALDATGFNVATDLVLPTLGDGLQWDTSNFLLDGSVAVPEPGAAGVAVIGMALAMRRRRRGIGVTAGRARRSDNSVGEPGPVMTVRTWTAAAVWATVAAANPRAQAFDLGQGLIADRPTEPSTRPQGRLAGIRTLAGHGLRGTDGVGRFPLVTPPGVQAFATSTLHHANSIVGTFAGDRKGSDPQSNIQQPCHAKTAARKQRNQP